MIDHTWVLRLPERFKETWLPVVGAAREDEEDAIGGNNGSCNKTDQELKLSIF